MLTRRHFFTGAVIVVFGPATAEAGLRERIQARKNARNNEVTRGINPVTLDYGPALLDVYAPEDASNLPVFIHVHGGGWRNGNRKYVQSKPEWFVKNGWVFVSIDYRMLPEAEVATQAHDVEAAYAYVCANIAEHGGDPARIAVSGHSAGCHLTALTGMWGGLPGAKALVLCDVDVYDIAAQAGRGALRKVHKEAFHDPSQWSVLSPATHVGSRSHPPVLIAYSKVKGHKRSALEFAARLEAAGTKTEVFDGTAYSHFAINRNFGDETGGFTAATMDFLSRTV
jgi:acetyl esterase/lipase